MANLKFADTHNMVVFLSKPAESEGFEQIMDFLNANPIKYALTINPTIYISCIEQFWSTVKAKTINGEVQLHALLDGKKIIITESIVRRDLQLEDAEGVDCLPNATIFEQLALMGYEQMRLSIRRGVTVCKAATNCFSLKAEQDSGNIIKTRSKATPNEAGSQGTTLGGGPRRQETMGDTIAQTRFENVSKLSNDPLLARGNTLRSGEDRLKLKELMELCTNLQQRVLDLEKTKTTQAEEIDIYVNVIPPDHVDDVVVIEPNQHDDVPIDPEPVLVENPIEHEDEIVPASIHEDDDVHVIPEHVLVDEDEDPEEDEFEEKEDPQEEDDDMEVDIEEDKNEPELTYPYEEVDPLNPPPPAFESEPNDVNEVENPIESKDETVPASVHEVGESSTAYFLREDSDGLLPGLTFLRFMFEERPNGAIDVPIEDEKSPSSEPRESSRES
ncbi:hypothetical protein Tco_0958504 [Tanacetum coccineum]